MFVHSFAEIQLENLFLFFCESTDHVTNMHMKGKYNNYYYLIGAVNITATSTKTYLHVATKRLSCL